MPPSPPLLGRLVGGLLPKFKPIAPLPPKPPLALPSNPLTSINIIFEPAGNEPALIAVCPWDALLKIKDKRLLGNTENFWIMLAILEISVSIYYIIGIQHGFYLHTNLNFWDIYEIRNGTIIPFIGGSITLIGAIIGKFINRKKNK